MTIDSLLSSLVQYGIDRELIAVSDGFSSSINCWTP